MRAYEGYACKSLLPTNGEGGKSLEEENILPETGINGPVFSPFIMKGYAGQICKPTRRPKEGTCYEQTKIQASNRPMAVCQVG